MPRGDEVAHAANWRTVLAVDAALGVSLAVAGVFLAAARDAPIGWLVVAAGTAYVGFVGRRYLRWRRIREDAVTPPRRPPRG